MSIKYIGKTDEVGIPPTKGQSHVYDVTTAPSPTTPRPPPFVTTTLATTQRPPQIVPHHYALIFTTLTIYRHKPENPNQKKNLRAKTIFLQKSCAQKNENKASPFFAEFLGRKIQSAIFGGSDLEKKPLEYINRRFYNFQFINRTKLNLEPTQISFYKRDHRPTNDNNNNYEWRRKRYCACGGSGGDAYYDDYRPNNRFIPVSLRGDDV